MNRVFLTSSLALLLGNGAFGFQVRPTLPSFSAKVSSSQKTGLTKLFSEDPTRPASLTSGRKEIAYDEKSGRFFETDAECIPDDEYCVIDKNTGSLVRLTVEEKERIFLDSLQSYYVSGRQVLNDSEFDALKEDLVWNGSPVAILNRKEAKYLAAVQSYLKGEPIISDQEFDQLKVELKEDESKFAVSTEPKCYIDTGICTVTFQEDAFRSNLLYLPAGSILFILWLGLSFELIEPLIRVNPLFLALLGSPLIYNGAKKITEEFLFTDKKIAYGPCPSCEAENRIYFGGILGVEGFSEVADIKCPNCKTEFKVQRSSLRASTLPKA